MEQLEYLEQLEQLEQLNFSFITNKHHQNWPSKTVATKLVGEPFCYGGLLVGYVDKNKILNFPLFRLSSVSTLKEISFSKEI